MNLKIKEIRDSIGYLLDKQLKNEGFIYKKSNTEFVKNDGDCIFIFNLLIHSWEDHYSIGVRIYITNKNVEKVYENIIGKFHKLTIGNTIERISKSPNGKDIVNGDMVILLFENEDLAAAADTLKDYYHSIAKIYYEKYKNLKDLDNIINNPPFEYCPAHVGGNFDNRCMKGLIIARLVGNPNYDKLVVTYNEAIKETMNQESIDNYQKVKDYLRLHH